MTELSMRDSGLWGILSMSLHMLWACHVTHLGARGLTPITPQSVYKVTSHSDPHHAPEYEGTSHLSSHTCGATLKVGISIVVFIT